MRFAKANLHHVGEGHWIRENKQFSDPVSLECVRLTNRAERKKMYQQDIEPKKFKKDLP